MGSGFGVKVLSLKQHTSTRGFVDGALGCSELPPPNINSFGFRFFVSDQMLLGALGVRDWRIWSLNEGACAR